MKNFFVLLLSFLIFTSCTKKENYIQNTKNIVIGYSQIGSESSWREAETKSVKDAASKNKFSLLFDDAAQKQENQIKAIRTFIAYKVDVIILSPMTEEGWENILNEAKLANIPVILLDRNISSSSDDLYTTFIGSDFNKEGELAAKFLRKKFSYSTKESINILELKGVKDSTPTIGRSRGFREGIKDLDNLKIIHSDYGDFMPSKGYEIVSDAIKRGIKIDVLVSQNDSMTKGAIKAMEENNIIPGKDVVIISFDGEEEMIENLKDGKVNCVVECSPYLGDVLMETVIKIKSNESIPKKIFTDEEYFTEWTDFSKILPRGY